MREKGKTKCYLLQTFAPAFMPSTPASAKGFRVTLTPCITAPATAKRGSTSAAPITLGSLNS